MSKYKFSVLIDVDSDLNPTDDSIGLEGGVFQWFLGGDWAETEPFIHGQDILSRDGISPISKSVKVERFGDIATSAGLTLKIRNTDIFWKKFLLNFGDNVSLHGSTCYVIQWENGVSSQIFVGVCDIPSFDKSTYKIPVRAMRDARDSNLTDIITEDFKKIDNEFLETEIYTDPEAIGKALPITFGENDKTFFLQTGDLEQNVGLTDSQSTKYIFPANPINSGLLTDDNRNGSTDFPIDVKISNVGGVDLNNFNNLLLEGFLFLACTGGNAQGEIGQVSTYTEPAVGSLRIILTKPFSINVEKAEARFKFVDIRKEYNSDFWNCEGFIDENDNAITSNAELFQYDQGYQELPRFALDINSADLNDNELIQKDLQVNENASDVIGFEIGQGSNLIESIDTTYFDDPTGWSYYTPLACFTKGLTASGESNTNVLGNISLEDGSSPFQWRASGSISAVTASFGKIYEYEIDTSVIPDSFDSAYVVMSTLCGYVVQPPSGSNYSITMQVKSDKWFSDKIEITSLAGEALNQVENFPYDYSTQGLNSLNFWRPSNFTSAFSGYRLIDLGISNKDDLLALEKLVFVFTYTFDLGTDETAELSLDFNALGLAFKQSSSIDKGVYTPFKGRLYDKDLVPANNWGQNDLIQDPIGALMHVKYLQNFSNIGTSAPASGWGKEYPSTAVSNFVETTLDAQGSYYTQDFIDFDFYDVKIAHQITESKAISSKAISKDICNRFFLISWLGDSNGKEQVEQVVQKTNKAGLQEVTQLEMLSYGNRIEWDTRNIFTEPVVNYAYDAGSKKFNKTISITNTSNDLATDAEKAAACKGMDFLTESQKVILWERARALFLYYGVINEPPKILSDHTWIHSDVAAFWYIRKWLRFQGSKFDGNNGQVIPKNYFDFSVPYEVGKLWDIGTRLNVKLPNITDDVFYEFIITSITKNVSDELPNIAVKGILFDLDIRFDDTIQDVTDNTAENWQDTTDDTNDIIQDEVNP